MMSAAEMEKKELPDSRASAVTRAVFPVPGGPNAHGGVPPEQGPAIAAGPGAM